VSRRWFVALLVAGALVRAAALPLPGTRDTIPWRIWSYNAAREGVSRLYGVGGNPPERRIVSYQGAETIVDMPPLAIHELGLAGRVYRALNHGQFPNTPALMVAIKMPGTLADIGLACLIYVLVRRKVGVNAARWTTIAYWINPAVILDGQALGYIDPQYVLPAAGGLAAAAAAWPAAAGVLATAALLTKPQAAVLGPSVALAIWNGSRERGPARALARGVAAGLATAAVFVGPIVAAGGGRNFLVTVERLGAHDMLSGNACNLWWLIGWLVRAQYTVQDYGVWGALTRPTQILGISRFMEVGYPNPRPIGAVLVLAAIAWAMWSARRQKDVWLLTAVAAFSVHAYATLGAQVHENHLYAAVPLLAIAAAGRRRFTPVFLAVSAIFALDLNIFYGISEDVGYGVPRGITIVDLSVVLAVVNCAALAWHAAVLRRECREPIAEGNRPAARAPASPGVSA
jgi:hypothetical protein